MKNAYPEAVARAVGRIKVKFPCMADPTFAHAVCRLITGAQKPSGEAQAEEWAYNSMSITIPHRFWGRNGKDNDGRPRLDYFTKLALMTDDELATHTRPMPGTTHALTSIGRLIPVTTNGRPVASPKATRKPTTE